MYNFRYFTKTVEFPFKIKNDGIFFTYTFLILFKLEIKVAIHSTIAQVSYEKLNDSLHWKFNKL